MARRLVEGGAVVTSDRLDPTFDLDPDHPGYGVGPSNSAYQCRECKGIAYNPTCPYCSSKSRIGTYIDNVTKFPRSGWPWRRRQTAWFSVRSDEHVNVVVVWNGKELIAYVNGIEVIPPVHRGTTDEVSYVPGERVVSVAAIWEAVPGSHVSWKTKADVLAEMIAFAEGLPDDLGPLFGRDVAAVLRAICYSCPN